MSSPPTHRVRDAIVADVDGIARVHVDSWRATYAGVVPDGYLQSLSYRERGDMWRRVVHGRRSDLLVAEVGGDVVGFASGGRNRDVTIPSDAELYAIYLLPDHLGRGLGRALLLEMARRFRARSFASMHALVLVDNPACRFYEAMGGERFVRKTIDIGGARLDEVAYLWRALPGASA